MKKVLSVLIVAIMVMTLCTGITVNAKDDTVSGFSIDWYAYAGAYLTQAGNVDKLLQKNWQTTYTLHADLNADIVGIFGWAALTEGTISGFGVKLDGGEMIPGNLSKDIGIDRTAELAGAGIANGEGYWITFNYTALGTGVHTAAFYAIGADSSENEFFSYKFTVVAADMDPNQWLCQAIGGMPGWWLQSMDANVAFKFTTPVSFQGMCSTYFTNGADLTYKLYDANGKLLEEVTFKNIVEGKVYNIYFSTSYGPGTYTIELSPAKFAAAEGGYIVQATCSPDPSMPIELSGNYGTCAPADWNGMAGTSFADDAIEAPFMFLLGGIHANIGDVNGDGKINNKDVVALFRYVSDDDVDGFLAMNADVNGDGKVNNKDVVALFRLASYPAPVLKGKSFNTVWVDGTQICDTGDALDFLKDNPITDAQKIGVRGWAYIGDYATLSCFGYSIDGGEPVFDASYLKERTDVHSHVNSTAYYANGFEIQDIDVSGLAGGAHTLTVYAKGSDGTNVKVVDVPFKTINLMTVNYDALYYNEELFFPEEGSIDKKIFALQDKSVLNFETGKVESIRVRGWLRVSENVADIAGFGYSLDGGAVVYDESFVQDRVAELADAHFPGGQGFNVLVPVKDLAYGEHTIDVYVKTSAGKEIKVVKVRGENDIRQVGVTFTAITYKGFSIDSLKVSGNEANLKTEAYLKKGDTITVLGWAAFSTGLKELVYEIDGVRYACSDTYRDRGDVCQVLTIDAVYGNHAGFGLDTQLMALTGTENLDLGEYTLKLIAVGNGGLEKEIKTLTLKVTENGAPVDPAITHTCVDSAADSGSAISGAGWTGATYAITALGYTVDGGDPIFDESITTSEAEPAVKADANAGPFGIRFSFNIHYGGLDLGQHTIQLVCKLADEDQTVLPLGNVISPTKTTFTVNVENEVR